MAGMITGYIQNKAINALSGVVSNAVTTVGSYAGDAVTGVGNLVEKGGVGVGSSNSARHPLRRTKC